MAATDARKKALMVAPEVIPMVAHLARWIATENRRETYGEVVARLALAALPEAGVDLSALVTQAAS